VFPNKEQLGLLGSGFYKNQSFGITVGREYLVLGLSVHRNSPVYGQAVCAEIVEDAGHRVAVPLLLFEVVDARASRHWRLRTWQDGMVTLWPEPFYKEYFFDDLAESDPETNETFRAIRHVLESEQFDPHV
jgi:hypothetical protein